MRFIHCSDLHLGKTLGNNPERYRDYFQAFRRITDLTISREADCLVIAGDLFHRGNISPTTLADTEEILAILKERGVPVIAIEGNHDHYQRRKDESWLLYLSRRGYLKLLRPSEDMYGGKVTFEPFREDAGWGGWYETGGYRFYGLGYWGHSVGEQLCRASVHLPRVEENRRGIVGILHAGVWEQDFMDIGRVTRKEFRPLSRHFHYVALGHAHRRYEIDTEDGRVFACNPGSPEVVNREEANVGSSGLVYLVNLEDGEVRYESLGIERRPYLNLTVDIEGAVSPSEALGYLEKCLLEEAEKNPLESRPVVMLDVVGKVGFNSSDLDLNALKEYVGEIWDPVEFQVINRASLVRHSSRYSVRDADIDEIFRDVIADLVREEGSYEGMVPGVVDLVYRVRDILGGESKGGREESGDEDILEYIHRERKSLERSLDEGMNHEQSSD